MPGSKNFLTLKGLEWLYRAIAVEFEKHRKAIDDDRLKRIDDTFWALFSLVGAYSIAKISEAGLFSAFKLPLYFLLSYFIMIRLIVFKLIIPQFIPLIKGFFGYKINTENKECLNKVESFNNTLCNNVLLANGFKEKISENDNLTETLKEYYLLETMHYLKKPIKEMNVIVNSPEILEKIINHEEANPERLLEKSIELYRFKSILDIIGDILNFISEKEDINDNHFNNHLEDLKNKYTRIYNKINKIKANTP